MEPSDAMTQRVYARVAGFVYLSRGPGRSLVASLIVPVVCFGTLIFPEHAGALQYGWAPMALAEIGIGFWLMIFAVPADDAGLAR